MSQFNSFVRIPLLALRDRVAPLPRLEALGTDMVRMRVWPNDIDFNLHLNNGRYLSAMDYGRMRLMARAGLLRPVMRARWTAVVGAVWMTYRRSLPLFARFDLTTRLVCWDERWFYMEQTFHGQDGLAAVGWVKGAIVSPNGIVAPQTLLEMVAPGIASPALPQNILTWNELTREKLEDAAEREASEPEDAPR